MTNPDETKQRLQDALDRAIMARISVEDRIEAEIQRETRRVNDSWSVALDKAREAVMDCQDNLAKHNRSANQDQSS